MQRSAAQPAKSKACSGRGVRNEPRKPVGHVAGWLGSMFNITSVGVTCHVVPHISSFPASGAVRCGALHSTPSPAQTPPVHPTPSHRSHRSRAPHAIYMHPPAETAIAPSLCPSIHPHTHLPIQQSVITHSPSVRRSPNAHPPHRLRLR
ncbi:hypothetical protein BKA81DRAFT_359143 [Phyllosticta paracitricarpa]